jgi:Lon protease-like protein
VSLVPIGLFPLPGFVLFPRTAVPLHIFEPRYVRLVRDSLKANKRLALGQLRRGWEKDYYGAPAAFRTVTMARILDHEELPNDRYNILVEGIERAAVAEVVREKPYRLVKVRSVRDVMPESDMAAIAESRRELVLHCERLALHVPELSGSLTNLENTHLHPGIIADQMAALLVKEAYERQSLLDEPSVRRRLELVNVQLRTLLMAHEEPNERVFESDEL